MSTQLLLIGILILYNIQRGEAIVCYQCTDCPNPFIETYPYVTLSNNTNFLAQCTKTVLSTANSRQLVTKGSVFFCPNQPTSADIQIYCCGTDFCNSSVQLGSPNFVFYPFFFVLIKWYT